MAASRPRGVLSPVVTPFRADLSPDAERLITHCKWLLSQNCGLAVFGTNSEANSLSAEEKIELLDRLVAGGVDPARMMPGTGACSIPESVRLTAHAVKAGAAGVLMLPPFYYKGVPDDGLFRHFSEVVQRVGDQRLRIYLYHIPPVAQVAITHNLVERLLKAYPGTIAGMKDSSGDWPHTRSMIDAFAKEGFDVFSGNELPLVENVLAGGAGCISATANVNPGAIANVYDKARAPDALALQKKINDVRETMQGYVMIPALKYVVAHYGADPAWVTVRPPLVDLPAAEGRALIAKLDALGFTMPGLRGSVRQAAE